MLDLGEGLLDGIKVGGIFRQEPQSGANRLDGVADDLGFVGAEIVEDDDVAGLEGRDQLLAHIGVETFAVDGAIEDAGRSELVAAQRPEEGQGAPAAVRGKAAQPLAPRSPASQGRHVGADPGFVDEDQSFRIEATLPGLPAGSASSNVDAALFKGEQRFFETQAFATHELPDGIVGNQHAAGGQLIFQPMQRQV